MTLKIQRLRPEAQLPSRATSGSAGMDLRACLEQDITLQPMERTLIPTGLAIELPDSGSVALLCARSGLALRQGLTLANGIGVIDSDYRGEVAVAAVNLSSEPVTVCHGDRIAQLLILPVLLPELEVSDKLDQTERGEGGFGSTGRG